MMARLAGLCMTVLLPVAVHAGVIALTGGRIHTLSPAGVIERGTVLIRDERIIAVGADVEIPADALVIEAKGAWITPGIFNSYTQLGLVENEDVASTMDHAAPKAEFAAGFDVQQGVNGYSTLIPIVRMRGVTRAAISPVSTRSIFGGQGALIKLDSSLASVFEPRATLFVELGAQGAQLAGGARGAAWQTLQAAFDGVAVGISRTTAARRAEVRRRSGDVANDSGQTMSDDDEAAFRAVSGAARLVAHVERVSDILNALALKQRYPKLRLILLGASEGWMVADRIAAAEVPVIVDSLANLPIDFETMAATQENAARLGAAGVLLAITPIYRFHAATPHNAGLVTQYAGNAVANGLPWEAALKAITLNPAIMFGVADRLGSLEPGKLADLVVWSGDPLELDARPESVFVAGQRQPMVSRQTKLRDRYRQLQLATPFQYRY